MALEKFITLSLADFTTLSTTGTVIIGGQTLTYDPNKYIYLVPDTQETITDGTNTVSIADLAALVTYAKSQGWIS